MKKQPLILWAILALFLFPACQEDIAVVPDNPSNSDGSDDDSGQPDQGIDPQYQPCLNELDSQTLDILTWNIEFFPKQGNTTIDNVYDVIRNSQTDIVGIQEVDSRTAINDLAEDLVGWEVKTGNVTSNLDLAYLYKTSEIELLEGPSRIYPNNNYAFPREPVLVKVRHKHTGLEVLMINIHQKCCGGSDNEDRRREASELLKKYIDEEHPNTAVVVLGDFNDDIYESGPNVFQNFMDDTDNYRFADRDVAQGPSSGWSYPSYPSHLDHLLITDELFDRFKASRTLTVNECLNTYYSTVSDHRPVMLRLE